MLSMLLWLAGLFFEFLLLVRCVQTKTLTKYIYFYTYIFCVFAVSAGLYIGHTISPAFYDAWYWPTQFATLGIGFGVVLEIVRQALPAYPGAERHCAAGQLRGVHRDILLRGMACGESRSLDHRRARRWIWNVICA